jgi:hypothetical protein
LAHHRETRKETRHEMRLELGLVDNNNKKNFFGSCPPFLFVVSPSLLWIESNSSVLVTWKNKKTKRNKEIKLMLLFAVC